MVSQQELAELMAEYSGSWVSWNGDIFQVWYSFLQAFCKATAKFRLGVCMEIWKYGPFHADSLSNDFRFDILRISAHIWSRSEVVLGKEVHRRSRPLLRQSIHNSHLHNVLYADKCGTCAMGDRTGEFAARVIVGASQTCTFCVALNRGNGVLKVTVVRGH